MTDQLQPSAMARELLIASCSSPELAKEVREGSAIVVLESDALRAIEQALKHAMPEREAIARIICEETMCPWDSGTTNYVAEYRPTPESREQIRAYRAADAILSLTGDVREAAPERGLRELWQKVSDELDHIPGGMHADLEDAASALWTAFDSSASPPAAPDMREAAREALEKVKRLAYGYELMHTAICHMAGTSGAEARWYMAKAQEVQSRIAPVWNITKESNASKPGDCMRNYLNAVPNLAALASSPMDAVKAAVEDEWQDISTAPKDGTTIWAVFHADIYPRIRPQREDLEPWNGKQVPLRHPGICEGSDGKPFDMGWNVAAPVGQGGFPDEWIAGWRSTPEPPTAIRSRGEG